MMDNQPFLLFAKQCFDSWCANSVLLLGEMPSESEIKLIGLPGFADALQLLQQTPQQEISSHQMVSLSDDIHAPFRFQEQKIELTLQPGSLQLKDVDGGLANENVYDIFKHFMIKKKNHVLFLVDGSDDKMVINETGLKSVYSGHKDF